MVHEFDFGCGRQHTMTVENGKPIKHIYMVEALVKGDPHLSCRMWDTYDRVSRLAIELFNSQNPTYQPVIHYINAQSENLDPLRPAKIVSEAAATNALAVVGFAWSTMAGIAASHAEKEKIPYISPTAVIRRVFDGKYSISLGTPAWEVARGFSKVVSNLEGPKILIVEATDQIQEREYAEAVREKNPGIITVQYQGEFPVEKVLSELSKLQSENHLMVIPGYTNLKHGLHSVLSVYPQTKVVVGPQWSHDHKLLDFDGEIYCISDYFNLVQNQNHDYLAKKWTEDGGEIIGGYLFSLFDALMFTLKALDSEDIKTRSDLIAKIKNNGVFEGTKGKLNVENGKVNKQIYILKYQKGKGFSLIEEV